MEKIKKMLATPSIKWVEMSGVYPEIVEERHIKLVMPLGDLHINHVNTAYAGSIFVLAEISAGALFFVSLGTDKYAPIVRKADIQYTKPATTDIYVEASLTEEELAEMMKPVEARGKGDIFVEMIVRDKEGNECAKANINLYCLPLQK